MSVQAATWGIIVVSTIFVLMMLWIGKHLDKKDRGIFLHPLWFIQFGQFGRHLWWALFLEIILVGLGLFFVFEIVTKIGST